MRSRLSLLLLLIASTTLAGEADVVDAKAVRIGPDTYTFAVTVRHADSGWDHYADEWRVLAPDGTLLATRVLNHPHVDEQPFTRTLENVHLPPATTRVHIRAHDKVHGFGGAEKDVDLPTPPPTK